MVSCEEEDGPQASLASRASRVTDEDWGLVDARVAKLEECVVGKGVTGGGGEASSLCPCVGQRVWRVRREGMASEDSVLM
jgi:hypothetical protein